jgi:hypothetical protein
MNAPGMHQDLAKPTESAQVQCDACPTLFTPKKRWQHFCSPKCRRAWHAWTRPAAVREARELVRMVLAGEADPATWTPRAKRLLGIK